MALSVAGIIVYEASVSLLGGAVINQLWWWILPPGLAIAITGLCFALLAIAKAIIEVHNGTISLSLGTTLTILHLRIPSFPAIDSLCLFGGIETSTPMLPAVSYSNSSSPEPYAFTLPWLAFPNGFCQNAPVSNPYQDLAILAKALGDPNRIFILENLAQAACAVEQLAAKTGLPLGNLSHHLQILKQSGLVKSQRHGRQIIYAIPGPEVVEAVQGLRRLHGRLSQQDRHIVEEASLVPGPKIPRSEALRLLKAGQALLLDVRPRDEFDAGHIRGALHIPLEELENQVKFLPRDKIIIAYCRGPYCQPLECRYQGEVNEGTRKRHAGSGLLVKLFLSRWSARQARSFGLRWANR